MTEALSIGIRTLLILLFLLLVSRILGRRTLSELTFYDFVIGLVIGEIGGSAITDAAFSIHNGIVAITVATLWVLAINKLSLLSLPARKLLEAEPLLVIHNSKILEDNLRKRYYNVNDLLEMLRKQGIFDPQQIALALIEPDGQLSVLKKQDYQTPTLKDFNLQNQNQISLETSPGTELIIDGKIIEQGLVQSGLTIEQLQQQLNNLGIIDVANITLAMFTPEGKLYVDKRNDEPGGHPK
ncbi:DUF421 domain-containing protein [Sporomusa sp.]|uniref:DUF421 domain-containing protein n=1 Tax=Sporomusa sp. TaxID=2078658 RepID=UPI002B7BD087|nr:DUF421 domain-containing protein [Sporomusa sp.]HWR07197.1 DUF421 domain-containing protein [Sporomusa sp.]